MSVSSISNSALSVKDLPAPPVGKRGWPWTVGTKPLTSCRSDGSPWPRLSIVTPSYNQGQFLEATIRSVLLQGYPDLEYIIVDGGSSDESVEIMRKYERYLSYWVSEKDHGQTDAINKGLVKTTGAYLGWLNSDDLYIQGAFGKVISAFLSHPESIVVHGNRVLIDAADRVFGCSPLPAFNPPLTGFNVCSETAFWKRSAMETYGLLNPNLQFAMDLEFFSRLFLNGQFTKLDDYLGYFRCHANSKSSTIWNVAKDESASIWQERFQAQWIESSIRADRSQIFGEFCKHPLLIGLPFLRTKINNSLFAQLLKQLPIKHSKLI
jgi:glycosyltransferase involved in cell wall biosynthesis